MKQQVYFKVKKRLFGNMVSAILVMVLWFPVFASNDTGPLEKNNSFQNAPQIKCGVSGKDVAIDGVDGEWRADRSRAINKKTYVGFSRDEDFIYVHLLTSDPEFSMQIMNFGLTIWFDPEGIQEKTVGIQFPTIQFQPPPHKEKGEPPKGAQLRKFLKTRLSDMVIEFPVIRSMKRLSMAEAKKRGINATIGVNTDEGTICYELQYPRSKPYDSEAMGLDLKREYMGVCIETPEIDPTKLNKLKKMQEKSIEEEVPKEEIERDIRPPRPSNKAKPPKPSRIPPTTRVSEWIKVLF